MTRAAIVLVDRSRVALTRRVAPWHDGPYYLFPGGPVKDDESPAEAAIREAFEVLGLVVWVERLVARGTNQSYFLARTIGGTFGIGTAPELLYDKAHPEGTHSPMWVELRDLPSLDVRPKQLATLLVLYAGMLPDDGSILDIDG